MVTKSQETKDKIVAVRYVDAFYFYKKGARYTLLKHIAVGKLIYSSVNYIILVFTEKNDLPYRGLFIPLSAIIFTEKSIINKKVSARILKKGTDVGITWSDILYFDEGNIPKAPTQMYTEGEILSVTKDSVVIHNKETLLIADKVYNYPLPPQKKPSYVVIPKSLIIDVESYEKK